MDNDVPNALISAAYCLSACERYQRHPSLRLAGDLA